jgi:hypothetical protein
MTYVAVRAHGGAAFRHINWSYCNPRATILLITLPAS